jgi:hypothetical protein
MGKARDYENFAFLIVEHNIHIIFEIEDGQVIYNLVEYFLEFEIVQLSERNFAFDL